MPHAKTDSDVTSLAASSPPRSPRRPAYYVMSPSPADPEKFSLAGSTPGGSPIHHFHKPRYLNSPIHHSRESTTGLSFSLKHGAGPWRKLSQGAESGGLGGDETEEEGMEREEASPVRCYACALLCFVLFFTVFSLILWGASKAYKPVILVKVRSVRSSSSAPFPIVGTFAFSSFNIFILAQHAILYSSLFPRKRACFSLVHCSSFFSKVAPERQECYHNTS